MKIEPTKFCVMANRHLLLLPLVLFSLAGPARAQVNININNSGAQSFAVDLTDHFLYVAQQGTSGHNLNVINTLTNTVVGSTTYSGSSYASQVAASGTTVFWSSQGDSTVQVFSVSGSGVPSFSRADTASLATGIAALSTTYGVSRQGADSLVIHNLAGTVLFTTTLTGVAGQVYSDSNTNRYYARASSSYNIINASTGGILGTLSGFVMAIDSSASHNFVYLQDPGNALHLDQLAGTATANPGSPTFYNFGSAFSDVAVNGVTGDIFVALTSVNQVIQLNSSMAFVQQFAVTSPQSLAFADGQLFVHSTGTAFLTAIAIPEPATWSALLGGLGLVGALLRRRAVRRPD